MHTILAGKSVSVQETYAQEISFRHQSKRRRVAQELIDFDDKFSRLISGRPAKDIMDETGVSMEEFKKTFLMGAFFTAGLSLNYGKSVIVAKEGDVLEQGDSSEMKLAK
jgi:hypothetical protein